MMIEVELMEEICICIQSDSLCVYQVLQMKTALMITHN